VKQSLSLIYSSPVIAVGDRPETPPRIGIFRPHPAPPALIAHFTDNENRAFVKAVKEEGRLVHWEEKWCAKGLTELSKWPHVLELCDVAIWHAMQKPARHWLHTGPLGKRERVVHDEGRFSFRECEWLWILAETAELGLYLEVRFGFRASARIERVARIRWGI
jgi:hypothetical protein